MKNLVAIVLLIVMCATNVLAQKAHIKNLPTYDTKTWHFGFTLGMNNMNFRIDKADNFYELSDVYGIDSQTYTGFHLGPLSNLRISKYVDLRMMFVLSFNQRDLIFHYIETKGENKSMEIQTMTINSTMLEFPIQFKYKAQRMTNFSPYVIAGGNFRYDLTGTDKNAMDENQFQLKKIDPCIEAGFGFDFYLEYFKLSLEIKYSLGILNTFQPNNTAFSNSIKSLKSNGWSISLHFE